MEGRGKEGCARDTKRRQRLQLAALIEIYRDELRFARTSEPSQKVAEMKWRLEKLRRRYLRLYAV